MNYKKFDSISGKKMKTFEYGLKEAGLILKKNESLATYTTIKVGGTTDFLVISENSDQLRASILLARNHDIPFIILGKGSNVIISDKGYRGLVIINTSKRWKIIGETESENIRLKTEPRFRSDYSGLAYEGNKQESIDGLEITVRTDSGVSVNYLMHELFHIDISGLQWYSGIPATVGGAIFMNMHGGEYYFGDLVQRAVLLEGTVVKEVDKDYFKFDYDWSILHQTREIILEADLCLTKGNLEAAQKTTNEWAKHKAHQPRRSAGCIFKNLSTEEVEKIGLSTTSVGYLIDNVLGLKGKKIGDAVISEKHAAFIENSGQATATEVYELIQLIKRKAKEDLGLRLQEEVQLIGKF